MDKTEFIEILPANQIKKGTYLLADDIVCKVSEYHTAKTGKHGSAKMIIKAYELISGKQKDITISTADKVEIPIVTRKEYSLIGLEDDYPQLIDENGSLVENIKLDNSEASERLRNETLENQEITVSVFHFMNQTLIDDYKVKKIE
jgi:translation initiation factor 5A